MDPAKIIDKISFLVAFIAFLLGFVLFFTDTWEFMKSMAAAIMLAALVWISYVMIRCLLIALKK